MVDLLAVVEAFLAHRRAMGCTASTLRTYERALRAFAVRCGAADRDAVCGYLEDLGRRVRPITAHQHFRVLRTFFRWCVLTGRLHEDPLKDFRMRCPLVLPRVPSDEDVRRLLAACPDTLEGRRNRALVCLLADSGLRKEEVRRLRVQDVDLRARLVRVVQGKGRRDRVGFFGEATASAVRAWLAVHPDPRPEAFLLVTREGTQLGVYAVSRILGRLCLRAGVRRFGPHALRHYAATSVLRRTGDLELVRRMLGHSTLAMALRYARLADQEVAAKYAVASPVDHLWDAALPRLRAARRP